MKQNTGSVSVQTMLQRIVCILLSGTGILLTACSSDDEKGKKVKADGEERTVEFLVTRADAAESNVMTNLSLFAFTDEQAYDSNPSFTPVAGVENAVTVEVDPAVWDFVLISCADQNILSQLTPPQPGQAMADAVMFRLMPDAANQYLQPMPELLYDSIAGIDLREADAQAEATLVRNVARVDVILTYEDFNTELFSQYPELCFLELWNVPTTLKWDGGLYPDKDNPDVATFPLHKTIPFDESNGMVADTVRFIVPAHRGADFDDPSGPQDITTSLLQLKASLPHPDQPGESFFAEVNGSQLIEIPAAPKMNWILEVKFVFRGPLQSAQLDVQVTVKEWDTYEQYENF